MRNFGEPSPKMGIKVAGEHHLALVNDAVAVHNWCRSSASGFTFQPCGFFQGPCYSPAEPDGRVGRREGILHRRREQKQATLDRRFRYNLGQASNPPRGELGSEL